MKRVQVLLSAYNGEAYIAQQVESILRQVGVHVYLLVRDDGSSDATWQILAAYAAVHSNMRIYAGENIGTQKSYFHLLLHADHGMDYYAFSDQDDVWLADKLQRAVKLLDAQAKNQPLLYAGNVIYASACLEVKTYVLRQIRRQPSFGNALVENICIGCTQVFNQSLLELVRTHPPQCEILHDWWFYLTAACFGKVCFDRRAFVWYRQHGDNQVGMQDTQWKRWKRRVLRFGKLRGLLSRQANDFTAVYKDVLVQNRELALVAGYRQDQRKKCELVMGNAVYRQSLADQWIYKLLFWMGYL